MADNTTHEEKIEKIHDLIKEIDFAMLTTVRPDGSMHSRPMATQKTEFDGVLWFFTSRSSAKVDEIRGDARANVAYANPNDHDYVSLSGRASLVQDRAKMEELWNPEVKAWFPKGLDDPELALLRIDVESAEYWKGPSSTVAYVVELAKGLVTGTRPDGGENEKVEIA
jgi:general stress protein 26